MNIRKNTKQICRIAMGIALYVVLSLCLQIPIFENYYICLGYIVMAIYCYSFGPVDGAAVGFLGCVLFCLLTNGLRGMPGWSLANLYIGFYLGLYFKTGRFGNNHIFLKYLLDICSIIMFCTIGIFLIKSGVEALLYHQLWILRIIKNTYAFIADALVLVLSLPICVKVDNILKRYII